MDLYIQIGVILLILTAFSLFAFFFTGPAQKFSAKINEQSQEVTDRLETAEGLNVATFMNSTDTPGTSLYPIIRDAKAAKIAVLVQTKNQQGLVVNYGYQLRSANNPFISMSPYGVSGLGANNGTDFEKNFVTTVKDVFKTDSQPTNYSSGMQSPMQTKVSFGVPSMFSANVTNLMDTLVPTGAPVPGGTKSGTFYMAPHLMLADPTVTDASKASQLGRTFSSTGFLYTDQVLKTDAPVNNNFSYADSSGSLFRFDQNASYYTTLVKDGSNKIVAIYVEEHGADPRAAVLGSAMLANGTITQLY